MTDDDKPSIKIINLADMRPKRTAREVTIAFAAAIIATLLALFMFGWVIEQSYTNATGNEITYTQGFNAALLIFSVGVLFNWKNR